MEYTYEPFGKTTQSGAANDSAYQYTGRENDGTGLMYYRARYYNPTTQRFISQDPMGFDGGDVNIHAYVRNNPISYVDPLGLYGTNSCSYYDGWCAQTNNQNDYYCTIAPMVCEAFNHMPIAQDWSQCVRQCLQEADNQVCANKDSSCSSGSSGSDKYPTCTAGAHLFCWTKCGSDSGQRPPGLFPLPK